jgi:hypothetical protein
LAINTKSAVRSISPKEYRHNLPDERSRIVSEIQSAWEQIKSLAAPLKVTIDSQTTDACLAYLQNEKVDGYDIFRFFDSTFGAAESTFSSMLDKGLDTSKLVFGLCIN